MVSRLSGARLKLARAEEHFNELNEAHRRFAERNPYRALREPDVEPGSYLWRIKIVERPPLEKWSALVGDCVHNLRAALDHTAYELVAKHQPPTTQTEFPIFKDRAAFDANYARKLPGVPPKVITQVKWLQPYRRRDLADLLWLIHTYDIIDKHRHLSFVSSALESTEWTLTGPDVTDSDLIVTEPCLGPFEDGAVVGRFTLRKDNPEVSVRTTFQFGIAFGKGEPAEGVSVPAMLESLRSYAGFVISRFERFM